MTERKRVGVGVGTIVTREDRVLLIRRKNVHGDGTWSPPGGHLEFGESLEECARRETHEETGIEVSNIRFRAMTNDVLTDDEKHYITIWMEAQYVSGKARVAAAYEMSEVGWFPWTDLPTPLFTCFENLVTGACYPVSPS